MTEPDREQRDEDAAEPRPDGRPRGRPFQPGNKASRGRSRGLAHATREVLQAAVHEGEDPGLALARFWATVYADPKNPLAMRMRATELLAERGWGKAPAYAPVEDDDPLGLKEEDVDAAVGHFDAEVVRLSAVRDAEASTNGSGTEGEPKRR